MASESITTASSTAQCTARRARIMPRPASTEITASIQNVTDALVDSAWPAASRCPAVIGLPGYRHPPRRRRPTRCRSRAAGRPGAGPPRVLVPRGARGPAGPGGRAGLLVLAVPCLGGRSAGGPEQVVVALAVPEPHRVRRRLHAGLQRRQQLLLGPDQVLPAVVRDLGIVGHGQRAGRAGLHAQAAEDAAQVVDLINDAVALARGVALLRRVVRALHVDGVGRAGPGAQLAADAFLQAVGPAVELVTAVEPGRGGPLLLGVLDRVDLPEHLPEGHAKSLDGVQEIRHRSPP